MPVLFLFANPVDRVFCPGILWRIIPAYARESAIGVVESACAKGVLSLDAPRSNRLTVVVLVKIDRSRGAFDPEGQIA